MEIAGGPPLDLSCESNLSTLQSMAGLRARGIEARVDAATANSHRILRIFMANDPFLVE